MLIKIIEPDFIFENESGKLVQLVREGWKQFNVITSFAGSKRGNHFHKYNEEGFFVIEGSFTLTVDHKEESETYTFRSGDMFLIPAYVNHSFEFLEDTTLVSMYSNGVELSDTEKDIWSD